MLRTLLTSVLLCPIALFAAMADQITIQDAFAREAPLGGAPNSSAYFTALNNGQTPVVLVGADSTLVENVELHQSNEDSGIAKMQLVNEIVMNPGETVLQPGGLHIMLMGMKQHLAKGEMLPLNLIFQDGSHKEIMVPVYDAKGKM